MPAMERDGRPAASEGLLVIGRFARLSGLSIGALRHYDEVDLLRPAWVDPATGYRSYRADQLEAARTIVRLRDLEVPLETIRAYLTTDDPAERRRLLLDHRTRIEARTFRLHGVLHIVGQLADATDRTETLPMSTPTLDSLTDLDGAMHRRLGVALFNHVWTLLERSDRTDAEIDEMIHAAHASRFHWSRADGSKTVNLARGEWQCARVYSVLGHGEAAIWHARRCLAYVEAAGDGAEDWDSAAAFEALSRAYAVAGDHDAAADWKAKALAALDSIADPDEREVIANDVATLPV
jgi:DNA-binding transcriptional MerR regulator